ncbi:hypothetical protein GCM10020331_046860 [Ectobacillus funiculus]
MSKRCRLSFFDLLHTLKEHRYEPEMITGDNKEYFFYMLPLSHVTGESKRFATLSELLDRFFLVKQSAIA